MRCPITLRVGKYKSPFQALTKNTIWACRTTTPWCGRVGANSPTLNDNDMVTVLHHMLIVGKRTEEVNVRDRKRNESREVCMIEVRL